MPDLYLEAVELIEEIHLRIPETPLDWQAIREKAARVADIAAQFETEEG